MSTKDLVYSMVIPNITGWGVFACIILSKESADLSQLRFIVASLAYFVVTIGGSLLINTWRHRPLR